jgi:hypothetical protein
VVWNLLAGYQTHLIKPVEPAELLAIASFAELIEAQRRRGSSW